MISPASGGHTKWVLALWIANIGLATISLAVWKEWLADEYKGKLKEAQSSLKEAQSALEVIVAQRDALQRMGSHIARIIQAKAERFRSCQVGEKPKFENLTAALAPEEQIRLIVKSIWEYFRLIWPVPPNAQLRFGIYLQSDDPNVLFCLHSTDGTNEGVIRQNSERLIINDVEGTKSQIVECFHRSGSHPAIIIEDTSCVPFDFFRGSEQARYLKSLLVLKYVATIEGEKSPIIFALDSSEPGYFKTRFEGDYRGFLVEMGRRLEYEFQKPRNHQKPLRMSEKLVNHVFSDSAQNRRASEQARNISELAHNESRHLIREMNKRAFVVEKAASSGTIVRK